MKTSPDTRQAESLTDAPRTAAELNRTYAANRPEGRKFQERAGRVLAGGVGHDLRHFEPVPLYIARGRGGRKWDVDGHEYVDFLDHTGDARHDRHGRVLHLGTFNASPPSAAAGIVALSRIAGGEPIERANRLATQLRAAFNDVLERLGIAGYVYGPASTFHVYFETDRDRVRGAGARGGLQTTDARRLKGMPCDLITQYQRRLRHHGADLMSSTGGVLSSAHHRICVSSRQAPVQAPTH